MSILQMLFGDPNKKVLQSIEPFIAKTNAKASEFKNLSDSELREKTDVFKHRLFHGETLDDLLPEAFAVVREVARRTIAQYHYDVQILGGVVLHRGAIAEMRTGEGKTLTATLPVYLHALEGKGVHVVTVNDYLAKRDAVWMGQIYHALGMSVGVIQQQMVSYVYDPSYKVPERVTSDGLTDQGASADASRDERGSFHVEMDYLRPATRAEAYAADITYGTNNEFGFDYLRDNMVGDRSEMVQRGLHYAIVDEVDSILIDEARTPLIISAPAEEATDLYFKYADVVAELKDGEDYAIDEKLRATTFTDTGIMRAEKLLGVDNLYVEGGQRAVHHLESALRAHALFKRDRDYVVKDGEVIIVDEFTGRLMHGRRYSEGLHQAIEAKERVQIQRESQTLATVTFQNYFRLYSKLSGMTGTAVTEAEEFSKIYKLEVVVIPPNKQSRRTDLPDRVFATENGKFTALVREVKERHEKGQPILIGTISIEKNEKLSIMLQREGVPHEILNAKNHEREGEIIAQAGRRGSVTLATNMAGRGVDIILGGNPHDASKQEAVAGLGGLFVIGTERHESRRIDNQLRGRSARQGDRGETQFYLSTEDDLMRIFGSERMKNMMRRLKVPEDMPIEHSLITKSIETAQKKVEGHNFDIRKHLLEYDDVLNKHREVIYKKRGEILDAAVADDAPTLLRAFVETHIEQEIEHLVFEHTENANADESDRAGFAHAVSHLLQISQSEAEALLASFMSGNDINQIRSELNDALLSRARSGLNNLELKIQERATIVSVFKNIMLHAIDTLWIEHLEALSYLRTGIGLRGYGQNDPLVEYKRESYRLFHELLSLIQKEIVYTILAADRAAAYAPALLRREGVKLSGASKSSEKDVEFPTSSKPRDTEGHKIGRNDPCYCGSGKKFKKCHGA